MDKYWVQIIDHSNYDVYTDLISDNKVECVDHIINDILNCDKTPEWFNNINLSSGTFTFYVDCYNGQLYLHQSGNEVTYTDSDKLTNENNPCNFDELRQMLNNHEDIYICWSTSTPMNLSVQKGDVVQFDMDN